jgi:hypothetical protein
MVGFWGMDLGCLLDVRSVSLLRKMCTLKKDTELKLLAGLLLVKISSGMCACLLKIRPALQGAQATGPN